MIVHCASFGTLWWLRPGNDATSRSRYTSQAALFNTTGFRSAAQERRNWTVPGLVRLNVGTCIDQRLNLNRMEPGNFETAGLERHGSQNRLLLTRRAKKALSSDIVLFAVSSAAVGRINFGEAWRSPGVRIVCASAFKEEQETLLLLPLGAQITTAQGTWRLQWDDTKSTAPVLDKIMTT